MPRVSVKVEGVEVVVDTGSRAQEPPSEAASPSSSDSFILLPAPTEAPSPLTGYLPYLQADPTRAAGAPRGSQEPPSSGAPYLAEAALQAPFPSSFLRPGARVSLAGLRARWFC